MEGESSSEDNESDRGGDYTDKGDYNTRDENEANNHEHISQSAAVGNKTPTPSKEGAGASNPLEVSTSGDWQMKWNSW